MLILTRRINESIVIDGETIITILEMRGNQARIGIKAPAHISVHRAEIQEKIDHENGVDYEKSPDITL